MTAAGTLRAMTGSPLNTTNCHLYHYAGNNPVKYVDPDGRISYSSVKRADPEKMDRDSARKWIRDEVVNDSRYPVCQILYELGLNGFEGIYEFDTDSKIANSLSLARNYANTIIYNRLQNGRTKPSGDGVGHTAFSPLFDTDLYGAFGGGNSFTWKIDSLDESTLTVRVLVSFEDTFDFNEGKEKRSKIGEKLTAIGRKAQLSEFTIKGKYYRNFTLEEEQFIMIKKALLKEVIE